MRTFNGCLGLINKFTAPVLTDWLKTHNIPYDEIYYGKPWGPDVQYIDDKTLLIQDFVESLIIFYAKSKVFNVLDIPRLLFIG